MRAIATVTIVTFLWSSPGAVVANGEARISQVTPRPPLRLNNRWENVTALGPGTRIAVKLFRGSGPKGEFVVADDKELTIRIANGSIAHVARADVRKVTQMVRPSTGKEIPRGALIGAGVGAGGAIVGLVESHDGGSGFLSPWIVVLVFAGVGAAIGAGFGALGLRASKVDIYEATRR